MWKERDPSSHQHLSWNTRLVNEDPGSFCPRGAIPACVTWNTDETSSETAGLGGIIDTCCCFKAWSFRWFVRQKEITEQGPKCPLSTPVTSGELPPPTPPILIPPQSQNSSPAELLALQQWVSGLLCLHSFAHIISTVLILPLSAWLPFIFQDLAFCHPLWVVFPALSSPGCTFFTSVSSYYNSCFCIFCLPFTRL